MQPKFTQGNYGYLSKFIATAMIFVLCTQASFSQQGRSPKGTKQTPTITAEQRQQKLNMAQSMRAATSTNNDRGVVMTTSRIENPPSTEAVCQTFSGALAAGDLTMPARLFRPGAAFAGTCAVPSPYPGNFAVAGGVFYDVHTYTNNSGLAQCATIALTTTDLTNANIEHAVYNNSFNPNDLAQNYLGDPGVSTGTPWNPVTSPMLIGINLAAGQTIVIVVMSANASTAPTGTASQYSVTIDLPICSSVPCSGTPAPGNTISSVPTVCPTVNFSLQPQNATSGAGVTYQWQSSPTGAPGSFTNIPGATSGVLTTSQSAATYYQVVVTCGANSGTSTPVQVLLTPVTGCYCVPVYTNGCTLGDYIARVVLGTLDNTSVCSTPPFTYYSAVPAPTLIKGGIYPLTVTVGPDTFGQFVAAWIDANQNGSFGDPGEYLGTSVNAGASGTVTLNITIPLSATTGVTRLRIRGGDDAGQSGGQSCGASNSTFGEAEDYNVNLQPCVPVTITAPPANTSIQCAGSGTISVATSGSLPSFIWQYRVNAAAAWVNITAATNPTVFSNINSAALGLANVPQSMNGWQFRAIYSNPCTGFDFTPFMTLTVTPLVANVATTPSPAVICSGASVNLRLTNVAAPINLIDEQFNAFPPVGWNMQNLSTPVGLTNWFQGNAGVFTAQSGAPDSYIAANFNNVGGANTISNWLITPAVAIKNGDVLKFWTRTIPSVAFPDRLEVRMNTTNGGTNVGATNTSVGDFTNLLLTINPTLTTTGYPSVWTEYTLTVSGLAAPVPAGRFAFRYFVTSGGPAGANSDYIGIDNVIFTAGQQAAGVWTSNVPAPPAANHMWANAGLTVPYTGAPATQIWVNPLVNTTYSVTYSTTTPACTSLPTNIPVTVVNPIGAITQPANRSACVGGSTTFTVAAAGGPVTYQWQVSTDGGATWTNVSGATGANLNLTGITQTMNNYRYRVVMNAAACASTATSNAAILTVNPLPTVTIGASSLAITPGVSTTITGSSTPPAQTATSWTWFYNGTQIVTTPPTNTNSITVGIDQLGDYQVRVTDQNGCVNVSNILTIGAANSDKLWIYPNPTDGQFQVRVYFDGPNVDIRHLMIYDESGRLVMRKAFDLFPGLPPYLKMDFDMTRFPAGTYVVKAEERFTGKVKSGLLIIQ